MTDVETRCLQLRTDIIVANPGEDVEVVDAVAVYVNFAYATAVCVSPDEDNTDFVNVTVTEWDRSGGVHSDFLIADQLRWEYVPVIVRTFLDEVRRRDAEVDAAIGEMVEEGGGIEFVPSLVDPRSFTHMQQVDNDGNPIGEPIPLKWTD